MDRSSPASLKIIHTHRKRNSPSLLVGTQTGLASWRFLNTLKTDLLYNVVIPLLETAQRPQTLTQNCTPVYCSTVYNGQDMGTT